jgi:NAD(P)-dependent dehydrogenase (short-subunit alcohol dehydrogenase family)
MTRLKEGSVAVVTGAGRGIGRVIAIAFAREGSDVVLAARSVDGMKETAKEIEALGRRALVVPTDITDAGQVEAMGTTALAEMGRVDTLVANSGAGGPVAPMWEIEPDDWDETFAVNVRGTYLCCRAFLPHMVERGSGSVVVIGSMTGKRPLPNRTPYSASKLALVGMVRSLALDTGPHGVRVNVLSPGPVEGERIRWVVENLAKAKGITEQEAEAELVAASPLGRFVPPGDIANAAVFLASDDAASIIGEDMNVSAGVVMY